MKFLPAFLLAAAAALPVTAQDSRDLAVQCGTLHVGNGQVFQNVWLIVRDGKIASISASRPNVDLPVLDASTRTVMPGLVAADTSLARIQDDRYNVTPDFVAADGFDFGDNFRAPLSGGVTTAYLSPGRNRLVSGQGSVVKLAGDDLLERVLNENAALRVTMGFEGLQAPRLFEPTPHPTSDDPLAPARQQTPTARIALLAELRRLFAAAKIDDASLQGPDSASSEDRYDARAFAQVIAGSLPLRIQAKEAADVGRALTFARRMGVKPILEDPWEFPKVIALARNVNASAVFRVDWAPGRSIGNDNRNPRLARRDAGGAAAAEQAGIPFALAAMDDNGLQDFLMIPAIAVRNGVSETAALRAVTLGAAEVLGVANRVGSLEPGKDADFLVLSGAPLAVGSMVEETWVDGSRCYQRKTDSSVLAVRTGRVLSGDGKVWRDGVLIAEKGRIKDVGEELAVPYGASVIDVPGGVMVPGFIDAFSHLGLAGRNSAVPQGSASQRVADAVAPKDPLFRSALEAGLTTVLVSGRDGGGTFRVAGRVAALKTGASDRDDMVLREIAGLRILYDLTTPDGINQLKAQMDRGKKYVDAWKKYEKALADFKAGKGEKPREVIVEEKPATTDPISGVWEVELVGAPIPLSLTLNLKLESGNKITGNITMSFRGRERPPIDIQEGTLNGKEFEIKFAGMGGESTAKGTVDGENVTGSLSAGPMGDLQFQGTRVAKGGEAPPAKSGSSAGKDDGSPKKPNIDENLEPVRALLERRATAVIVTDKAPAIQAAIAYLKKEKVRFVLQGAADAAETPEILGDDRPGLLLAPGFVTRKGRAVTNRAATMADAGLPVALVSAAGEGGKTLPLHAAYAVRYGMSPQEALAAVTSVPAAMFGIDDRVGSLEKGKDADFAVFSGNPFEPTSRVLLVVVNGKIVVDNREGK